MKAIGLKITFQRQDGMIATRQEDFDRSLEEIIKNIFNQVPYRHWIINKIFDARIIFDNRGSYFDACLDCSILNRALNMPLMSMTGRETVFDTPEDCVDRHKSE